MSPAGCAVAVAAAGLLLQAWPRWRRPLFGVDVWRHLLMARFIRRHRRVPGDGELSNHLFSEGSDYPPLLRILLAWCPERWWLNLQRVLAPLFDVCHTLTLFAVAWALGGDLWLAVIAQLAYLVNPLIVMENSNLSTRSFSSLLFTWSLLPLLAFGQTGAWVWFGAAVILLGLLLLSHRLAVQAMAMVLTIFTIVHQDGRYLLALAGGMLVATAISRGFYLKVLRGHWLMLDYWRRNSANRFAHQIRGFRPSPNQGKDVVLDLYRRVASLPAAAVIAGFPMVWLAVTAAVVWWSLPDVSAAWPLPAWVMRAVSLWTFGLLGLGLLVRQVPALRFLGEGERYGEYAAFPAALLAAAVVRWGMTTPAWAWWLVLFAGLAIIGGLVPSLYLQRKVILEDRERSITEHHQAIYGAVRRLMRQGPVRLMTIPLGLADGVTYFTECPVLATDSSLAHWRYYGDFSPVLRQPLAEILQRFGVTHLLVNQAYVGVDELRLSGARPMAAHGPLVLLECPTQGILHADSSATCSPEALSTR